MHEVRNPDERVISADPLRVVHVVQTLKAGGAETLVRGLCAGLAEAGIAVTVVSIYPDDLSQSERAALGFPVVSLGRRGRSDFGFFPRLVATLRELAPDVVHAHLHAGKYAAGSRRSPRAARYSSSPSTATKRAGRCGQR